MLYVTYDQYAERWDEIASVFSRDAVWRGDYDRYAETTKRKRGTITFDLKKAYRIRQVRVHVLIRPNGHGTKRIELRRGPADGAVLAAVDPAADGWNEFSGLDVAAQRLTLVLTAMQGRPYTTLSEVEIWGDVEERQ